jgi:opacity protein-like surface antigen
MIRSLLTAAALALILSGTAAAVRVVSQPEGAYEVRLSAAVLPRSTAGYVIFKPCDGCDSVSLQVTAATTYSVDGASVPFAEFIAAAEEFRGTEGGGDGTAVYVFYDVETRRVNRLAVDPFGH